MEATRAYTDAEKANLLLIALYSAIVEPGELAKYGKLLLGDQVTSVVFSSEDGETRFEVADVLRDSSAIDGIKRKLEPHVRRAT